MLHRESVAARESAEGAQLDAQRPSGLKGFMQRVKDERDEVSHRRAIREAELAAQREVEQTKEHTDVRRQLNGYVERGRLLVEQSILANHSNESRGSAKAWRDEVRVFLATYVPDELQAFRDAEGAEGTVSLDYPLEPPTEHGRDLYAGAVTFTIRAYFLALSKIRDRHAPQ